MRWPLFDVLTVNTLRACTIVLLPRNAYFVAPCDSPVRLGSPRSGRQTSSSLGLRERFREIVADVPHRPSLAEDGFPIVLDSFNEPQLSQSSHA
jgi:hypothetical protein